MSNQNSPTPDVQVEETAKEPHFTSEEKPEKQELKIEDQDRLHQVTGKAQAKLNNWENQFVSLSSQRQLNFIIGVLVLLAGFTGAFGMLISLILGTLMIVQASTGNMIINDFFDRMDAKQKRWAIPGLIGLVVFVILSYIVMSLITPNDSGGNSSSNYSQRR